MTRMRISGRVLALVTVLALFVAACSGMDTAESGESDFDDVTGGLGGASPTTTVAFATDDAEAPADVGSDGATSDELGSGGVAPPLLQTAADLGRDIIFTADMTVAVDDVASAGAEATRRIQALGGFLFGQQTTADPEPRSVLVFKVFPEDFQEALDRLGSIGELRSQNVFADDVTERVVDIRSRITTAEASVERLRGFLEGATDIDAIADLENQLLQRETQLETLRGQLRTLEDAVSLATITLMIAENAVRPAVRVDVTAYSGVDDDGLSCPGASGLTVDQGTEVTVCFEIVNVGDTDLTNFTLRDPVIDVTDEDLIPVFGDMSQTLEPGESIVVAAHIRADRSWRTQTNVTALPVDTEGAVREGRSVANTATISISAVDPGGVPGFGEGLERSFELLVMLVQFGVYLVAAAIPFFWIPLGIWWLLRRRNQSAEPEMLAEPEPETASVSAGDD
ncbi:MAG TPA: DUF4349 domain-containing protein [Acidimicrobiia bacterium]|nr:DUF4349 domain-containing protein [Acidimicrobiia bacterium]